MKQQAKTVIGHSGILLFLSLLFSCNFPSSSQSNSLPTVTTKYGVNLSTIAAFDSVTVDISIGGVAQGHSVYTAANEDAASHKIRWDIVAQETNVVKVNTEVWYGGQMIATQTESYTSGQAPQIPAIILGPTVTLPSQISVYSDLPLYTSGLTVSATATSTTAYLISLALDFNGDGIADTTISGGVAGLLSLSVANAKMYNAVAGQTYTATATVTDVLGRSFKYSFPIVVSNGLGDIATFTDPRDGQAYPYRRIGTQTWMLKNLNYVPSGTAGTTTWCYNDSSSYCAIYGVLYTYQPALTACPAGWHLPDTTEWNTLENFADWADDGSLNNSVATSTSLKSVNGWNTGNTGTDIYGFSALPGGDYDGTAYYNGNNGYWWTATAYGNTYAWYRLMYYNLADVGHNYYYQTFGFSVRCLKDSV